MKKARVNHIITGESYIIGGAYDCTAEHTEYCNHVNVQRAVVKLSHNRCGLDIVMDGISKKLPYDMREHSCAAFQGGFEHYTLS